LAQAHEARASACKAALETLADLKLPVHKMPLIYRSHLERAQLQTLAEQFGGLVEGHHV
jgi:hypothetical protein